ncbi:hypothetical protein chiPu_0005976 [Chiloscyllium punctatum]|uniref:Uncharacterized protein n=1 Tax=Chiloscyllium punctatum TaxID=137246 RepID=A0A401SAW9_CHIPU|nr:hypothetical protein [Chiloscyllium punctatum]
MQTLRSLELPSVAVQTARGTIGALFAADGHTAGTAAAVELSAAAVRSRAAPGGDGAVSKWLLNGKIIKITSSMVVQFEISLQLKY